MTYEALHNYVGQRVRLTYPNTGQTSGFLSAHDYGHTIDYRIDGHGGFWYNDDITLEVMGENGRYEAVES